MKTFKQLQQNLSESKSMVAVDKKGKMKYLLYGERQKIQYKGKDYQVDKVANALVLHLKGIDKISPLTRTEVEKGLADGTFKVIDPGTNPQHAVKIR